MVRFQLLDNPLSSCSASPVIQSSTPQPRRPTRIVGGMFGLEHLQYKIYEDPTFLTGDDLLLVNARSGLFLLIETLSPAQVWAPSYLCPELLEPIRRSFSKLRFYEVNAELAVPSTDGLDDVQAGDIVILIDYFGFPCDKAWAARAKERSAWILEDASQALLSDHVGGRSDFVLFSPRKFIGVPDGGILRLPNSRQYQALNLSRPPVDWWMKALSAAVQRACFDLGYESDQWFELFQQVEAAAPVGPYAMSELSETILRHGVDYARNAAQRIHNYRNLHRELSEFAVLPPLEPGIVPLGFPIRAGKRDRLRQALFEKQIYPPVHWHIAGSVPELFKASHALAEEIMTLPCDQRVTDEEIERMVAIVLSELKP